MTKPWNTDATMNVGLDLAKNSFQVYYEDEKGKEHNRKLSRAKLLEFFSNRKPCNIGMEACGSAHYWARTLAEMGHYTYLVPAVRAQAFRINRNKTDAADAKAICEAMMHHGTTFVAVKTVQQQDLGELFGRRERLLGQSTQIINQTRGYLMEHGIVIPQGKKNFSSLLPGIISENWESFTEHFQKILTDNYDEYLNIQKKIEELDAYITEQSKGNETVKRLMKINGVGPVAANYMLVTVGDATQFKNGRQMANYLGLTPGEHSTGGKQRLTGITKRGNRNLRCLLILGGFSAICGLARRAKDENGELKRPLTKFEEWIKNLACRIGISRAKVAVANKIARIAWSVITKGEDFDPKKCVRLA